MYGIVCVSDVQRIPIGIAEHSNRFNSHFSGCPHHP
jgi:hypothetical protein